MCQTWTPDFWILYQRSSERDIEEYCQEKLDTSTLELFTGNFKEVFFWNNFLTFVLYVVSDCDVIFTAVYCDNY